MKYLIEIYNISKDYDETNGKSNRVDPQMFSEN